MRSSSGEQGRHFWPLTALMVVLFATFLDTTIVAVALASIQSTLHAGVSDLQWVVGAYAIAFCGLMLLFGSIGDRYGRKRTLVAGMALFGVGALVSALAPSTSLLITGRAIMGVGAAASEPGTLSLLRHIYLDRKRRARALGVWAAVAGLAIALGPVLGGVLVNVGGFRAIFWFSAALAGLGVLLATLSLPESYEHQQGRLDLLGAGTAVAGIILLAIGAISGESFGYSSAGALSLFVVGALLIVAFLFNELRTSNPLINLGYLKKAAFDAAIITAFAVYFSIFAIYFFTALYLEIVKGFTGYHIALEFTPMTVAMIVVSLVSGRLVGFLGARYPMSLGALLAGIGVFAANVSLNGHVATFALAVSLTIAGVGFGLAVVPVTALALSAIPSEHSGMAAATTNTARALGVLVSVTALGSLLNGQLTTQLASRLAHLGVPASFRAVVIHAVETGGVPAGSSGPAGAVAAYGKIVTRVIDAAYDAFHQGLSLSLIVAASIMIASAILCFITVRRPKPPIEAPIP